LAQFSGGVEGKITPNEKSPENEKKSARGEGGKKGGGIAERKGTKGHAWGKVLTKQAMIFLP